MLLLGGKEYERLSQGCTPIDPYNGMPERYRDYNLVLDHSVNDMILKTPCRDGFKLAGNKPASNLFQCMIGAWSGLEFPECEGEGNLCAIGILFSTRHF